MAETREYHTKDKSSWPRGQWDSEPDKKQWTDESTGLPCLIVRGPLGALCGYVGVSEGHKLFSKEYGEDKVFSCGDGCSQEPGDDEYHYECTPQYHLRVHGGITFTNFCAEGLDESKGICHVASSDEPAHVWWFGFDCGHSGDFIPGMNRLSGLNELNAPTGWGGWIEYRDFKYVEEEVRSLAKQLKELSV